MRLFTSPSKLTSNVRFMSPTSICYVAVLFTDEEASKNVKSEIARRQADVNFVWMFIHEDILNSRMSNNEFMWKRLSRFSMKTIAFDDKI